MHFSSFRQAGFQRAVALLSIAFLIYTPIVGADQLALPSDDLEAPEIKHEVMSKPLATGQEQSITATVTDNVGVKSVLLYFRHVGEENYQRQEMQRDGDSDRYIARFSEQDITAPGIEYYIQATDFTGNKLLHGFAFSPLVVHVLDPNGANDGLATNINTNDKPSKDESSYKWLWIALGVVAVGALAGGGGGGDGKKSKPEGDTAGFTINAPLPGN